VIARARLAPFAIARIELRGCIGRALAPSTRPSSPAAEGALLVSALLRSVARRTWTHAPGWETLAAMGQAAARVRISPEEYLALERSSEVRHEYANGEIFAMAGATREHNLTAGNIYAELRLALLDRPCEVYTSDMRIKVSPAGRYVYPDVAVTCEAPAFEDGVRDTLLNPRVVVEVLSDSTEAYDRGDKFALYQGIPSFQEYVLASQKEPRIDHFRRLPDGSWIFRTLRAGDRLVLASIECEILVERAYLKVFAPHGDAPP
jgi:Uma2 family endonuclease